MLNLKLRRSNSASGEKGLGGVLAGMTGVIAGTITVGTPAGSTDPLRSLQGMLAGGGLSIPNSPKRRRKSLSDHPAYQQGSKQLEKFESFIWAVSKKPGWFVGH